MRSLTINITIGLLLSQFVTAPFLFTFSKNRSLKNINEFSSTKIPIIANRNKNAKVSEIWFWKAHKMNRLLSKLHRITHVKNSFSWESKRAKWNSRSSPNRKPIELNLIAKWCVIRSDPVSFFIFSELRSFKKKLKLYSISWLKVA